MKTPTELEAIRRDASLAAEDVASGRVDIHGPRTWKSCLWCYQVRAWIDDEGREGLSVHLDSADHDSPELCRYVAERLAALGHGEIEVVSDW